MTLMKQFRRSPRWLVLLVGFAALTVATAALIPHEEGNAADVDCLVCKAGHQPLTELSAELVAEPPLVLASALPVYRVQLRRAVVLDAGSPRAPPV